MMDESEERLLIEAAAEIAEETGIPEATVRAVLEASFFLDEDDEDSEPLTCPRCGYDLSEEG